MSQQGGSPFGRALIANRGEIALRIIRACRELGISPVAVYGEGEEQAMHVRAADDAYRIPPGPGLAYLDIAAIVDIARRAGAGAVHPGYGFLAENEKFAEAVEAAGLAFVGPAPANIRSMGDKVEARKIAIAAGVPVTRGTDGPVSGVDEARAWAHANGYPVAIKAVGGGGGRGFRVARSDAGLEEAFTGARGEATRYFANPSVYLERYLDRPRHVEVQVFGDTHGNYVALGERDCSVQRRHQKLVEETPSPAIDESTRQAMWAAARMLAQAVRYRGAGTAEFLVAEDRSFAFLEMNTRIQVEHTVTEMTTGFDLVKEQFLVAAGRPLSFSQEDVRPRGHSIQCRINAEDAAQGFKPIPGTITKLRTPDGPGVRVDTAIEEGGAILPAYDSLIAKLVVWGRDRDEALARMARALNEFLVQGVPTTVPFHSRVIANPVFRAGEATTAFLSENPDVIPATSDFVAVNAESDSESGPMREVLVEVDGRRLTVRLPADLAVGGGDGGAAPRRAVPKSPAPKSTPAATKATGPQLMSPLQGTIVRIPVAVGQAVAVGELVCVVEAMKMENEIVAHRAGVVSRIPVAAGEAVKIGAELMTIDSPPG